MATDQYTEEQYSAIQLFCMLVAPLLHPCCTLVNGVARVSAARGGCKICRSWPSSSPRPTFFCKSLIPPAYFFCTKNVSPSP